MALSKPRLTYFSSRGLCEPIRVLLAEAGVDYEDVGVGLYNPQNQPEGFTKLKESGKLMFDQLPVWEEPNGFVLTQSVSILRHLARTNGLAGANEQEQAICESLIDYVVEFRTLFGMASRGDNKEAARKNIIEVDGPKHLARLDNLLKKNGTGFFVGSKLTVADLFIWYYVEVYSDQQLFDPSKYENLSKFKASVENRPTIAKYRANPNRYPVQQLFPRYVIYTYEAGTNAAKSQIAALYGGITIDQAPFTWAVTNKTPEFLKKNPNGEVPLLDTPEGPIYESNAMARYVARKGSDKGLYGTNDYEASLVDQWIEWYRSKLEPPMAGWVYPIFGYGPNDAQKSAESKAQFAKHLAILNQHLDRKQWIVGNRVTVADIVLFCNLYWGFIHAFAPEFLQPFDNVVAWAKRCNEQPHFKTYLPKFEFATREKGYGEVKDD